MPRRNLEPKVKDKIDKLLHELKTKYDFKPAEVAYSIIRVGLKSGVTFRFHSRIAMLIKKLYSETNPLYGIITFVKKNKFQWNLVVEADDTESRFIAKLLTRIRNDFKEKKSFRVETNKKKLEGIAREIIGKLSEEIVKICTLKVYKEKTGRRLYVVRVTVPGSRVEFNGKTSSLHLLEKDLRSNLSSMIMSTGAVQKILQDLPNW